MVTSDRPDRPSLWFLLRPRWILFHLLVITGIVVMVNLGFWQLRRLDQRRTHNAAIVERYDAPAVPLDDLVPPDSTSSPADATLGTLEWRPVEVTGTYEAGSQITIVNRSQDGSPGSQSLAALRLQDGRVLLVNRGFVPLDSVSPSEPTGVVQITGHLRLTQTRHFGALNDPATGTLDEAQRIDIERLAPQYDAPVVPMYIELTESNPSGQVDGIPAPVRPPTTDEGNHLSYALQWFSFSGAVAVGWVLAVRHSIAKRRDAPTPGPAESD